MEFLDTKGPVRLESDADLSMLRDDGFLRSFHLDANLALDLARLGEGRQFDYSHLTRLGKIAAATRTSLMYDLAVEELAAGAARVGDVTRRTTLIRDIALGIKQIRIALGLQRGAIEIAHLTHQDLRSYRPVCRAYYAHLLKIEQIAKRRPGRDAALQNVEDYLGWANEQLQSVVAHCVQTALDNFGGEPRAQRLLRINSTRPQEGRAWNAAWDLIHGFAMHIETLQPIGHVLTKAILATRDKSLAYVAQRCIVAAYVKESPLGDMTLVGYRFDQPFLSGQQPELRNCFQNLFDKQRKRIDRGISASHRDIDVAIAQLEAELGLSRPQQLPSAGTAHDRP